MRSFLIWSALALAVSVPLLAAALSPLLAWREPVYILAGFAGIIGLGLMLLQPLLVAGDLPGQDGARGRRTHRVVGVSLVAAVVLHVMGLWITSPPDVVDALLFVSPTPFSVWGVLAMWGLFAAAALAAFRKSLTPRVWRRAHTGLVVAAVLGTVVHAVQIQGTMEPVTKWLFSGLVLLVLARVVWQRRAWAGVFGRR